MSLSDEELVALILTQDTAAFEVLMRRYFRMAFLVAYLLNGKARPADGGSDLPQHGAHPNRQGLDLPQAG